MSDDRRRPAQYDAARDDVLRSWLGSVVHPYSPALGPVLDAHGFRLRGKADTASLQRLPIVPIAELGDGRRHVLEPSVSGFGRSAPLHLQLGYLVADVFGRANRFAARHVDPDHRPVVWTTTPTADGPLFIAHTRRDLDRLSQLGHRALDIAGVRTGDRAVVISDGGASLAHLQFVEGCRYSGVPSMQVRPAELDSVAAAKPTVLAGGLDYLRELASHGLPASVRRTITLHGEDPGLATPPLVVPIDPHIAATDWWVPPGGRAAWAGCDAHAGFHTWPEDELVEIVDGPLVWTAVGWHGSVWLRVDTGVSADLTGRECECGRTTPRILPPGRTTHRLGDDEGAT